MKFKRYICVLLIILSVFSVAASAETAADTAETTEENDKLIPTDYVIPQDEEMTLRSRYAMLYSEYDKRVLFSKREDELVEPASTTKIMVGIMIFEKYGNHLDTQITVTEKLLADKEGLSIYLEPGETLTIRQLLTVLLMHGANDVSTILAHYYMQDISKGDALLEFAELVHRAAYRHEFHLRELLLESCKLCDGDAEILKADGFYVKAREQLLQNAALQLDLYRSLRRLRRLDIARIRYKIRFVRRYERVAVRISERRGVIFVYLARKQYAVASRRDDAFDFFEFSLHIIYLSFIFLLF